LRLAFRGNQKSVDSRVHLQLKRDGNGCSERMDS
jgi:hypothetical protein